MRWAETTITGHRYGWYKHEVIIVLVGWLLLLAASWGFLWCCGQHQLLLMGCCGVLMFIGVVLASSIPDGTTMRDSIAYLEGLHRHAWADMGWSEIRMEEEFRRALRTVDPASVIGGQRAIDKRLRR